MRHIYTIVFTRASPCVTVCYVYNREFIRVFFYYVCVACGCDRVLDDDVRKKGSRIALNSIKEQKRVQAKEFVDSRENDN